MTEPAQVLLKFRNRNKRELRVPASSVRVNPKNWRTHPDYQTGSMRRVLERIGFVGRLICWEPEPGVYELIDGHLRKSLLGTDPVDIVVTDLTADEVDELLAVYDQISSLAVPDTDKLTSLLKQLQKNSVPLPEVGWPEYKLEAVMSTTWIPPAPAGDPGAPSSGADTPSAGGGGGGGSVPSAVTGPAGPGANGFEYSGKFAVIVECKDEQEQRVLYERLHGEGLKVKVVVV